jgi:YVTN family beta-propeller protein
MGVFLKIFLHVHVKDSGMKCLRAFVLLSLFLLPVSCVELPERAPLPYPADAARLLLYLHSTSLKPDDVEVSSIDLIDRQILLKEAFVEPGSYKSIKIGISSASIKRGKGRASLALPQPEGEVSFTFNVRLERKESSVVSFEWDPNKSVSERIVFEPAINVEPQKPSPREVLLFISNSASNYISVIDTSLERVIGAVTVEDRPMGMVLNLTNDNLYVVNSGSRDISIVEVPHFYVTDTIFLPAGIGPRDIVFMPDPESLTEGKLYITNTTSNDVTVVSTATKRIIRTIRVGEKPSQIAADTERREIYVTNEQSNNMSIISANDDSVLATITVDVRPTGLTIGEENIYVFNEGSSTISKVSPSSRTVVDSISLVEPAKRGIKAFNERLFVANTSTDTLTFLDPFDVVTRTLDAGAGPIGLADDEQRDRLYVTNYGDRTVTIFDPIREMVVNELTVGESPYGAVLIER